MELVGQLVDWHPVSHFLLVNAGSIECSVSVTIDLSLRQRSPPVLQHQCSSEGSDRTWEVHTSQQCQQDWTTSESHIPAKMTWMTLKMVSLKTVWLLCPDQCCKAIS